VRCDASAAPRLLARPLHPADTRYALRVILTVDCHVLPRVATCRYQGSEKMMLNGVSFKVRGVR
jgi:hypothetical protein